MTIDERIARIEGLIGQVVTEIRHLKEEVKRATQGMPAVLPEMPNEYDEVAETQPINMK